MFDSLSIFQIEWQCLSTLNLWIVFYLDPDGLNDDPSEVSGAGSAASGADVVVRGRNRGRAVAGLTGEVKTNVLELHFGIGLKIEYP